MPAQSKAQQRFFGVVKAMQKGDKPKEGEAGKVAKSMKKKDVDDFASTKHKGKPEKVKREMKVRNLIKNMVREELQENMCFDLQTERCWKGYTQKGMKKMFGKMYPNCVKIKKKKSENVAPNHDGKAAPYGSGWKKSKEVEEAITGSDRKVMMMIVRDILGNLKKAGAKKPSNAIGRGVLSILRAMTYTKDNANYKQYKKYFPKTFNSKLTQKRVAQFHKQTDKVQLTMVKQAMNKVLGEGKITENKVYSKKDGLKIVKKLQAKDKKIYKVDKQKATYGGKKVTMYNLYTKDKQKYSGNNLHGLDMARNSKGEAMYLVPIKESSGKQIAQTILQQLGGNKFIAMTGAKNLGFTGTGLQMKIGRNAKGVTHVIIDLDRGKDLYNIEFVKIRGVKRTTVKKLKGVYADQLGKIFTKYTGLRTRL